METATSKSEITEFSLSSNSLAQKLFSVLEPNCIHSPLSISYILSLLHFGAINRTEKQFTDLMGTQNTIENLICASKIFNTDIIKLANTIIVNKLMPIKKEYLELVSSLAMISNEDFSNPALIVEQANNFIEKNTNGLIKDILKIEMVDLNTIMILINTIYFKTCWSCPFNKNLTCQEKFNGKKLVNMMTNTEYYLYYQDKVVQMVELSYQGNEFCMGFILPRKNKTLNVCSNYLNNIKLEYTRVEVHIPKFIQRKNINLIESLKKLGLIDIFDMKKSAMNKMIDISGQNAYCSTMIHEAVIIVDEEGTEAAAVTVAVMMEESCCYEPDPEIFYANHSFVYYIKHRPTNTLIFVGDYHGN